MSLIHPVILCGGSGTRLWPRSRKAKPKPFLPLIDDQTLFDATLARCGDVARFAPPLVVSGREHLQHVERSLPPGASVIVEPEAKSTAAAIALAAARLPQQAVMLVCPSDHHIADPAAFGQAVQAAAALAAEDWMVCLGIAPTAPETGYGYIKRGSELEGGHEVARFVEKPDRETAQQFLADGSYSWNGGIFAFRAGAFLDELARYRPALATAVRTATARGRQDGARFYPDAESFAAIEPESVDYAVMEETDRAAVVPAAMGWSDIGNWQALRDVRQGDADGNRVSGPAEMKECRNVLVDTDGPRVSAIGLSDIAIVIDGDEVLVTTMEGAQLVGKLKGAAQQ